MLAEDIKKASAHANKKTSGLCAFVHVSTAFAHCLLDREGGFPIEEKMYPEEELLKISKVDPRVCKLLILLQYIQHT